MKKVASILFAAFLGANLAGVAFAGEDDANWVAKCVKDNAKENVSVETMTKYCTCMNSKMSDGETLSITAWEQKNPKEMAACEKESGWK